MSLQERRKRECNKGGGMSAAGPQSTRAQATWFSVAPWRWTDSSRLCPRQVPHQVCSHVPTSPEFTFFWFPLEGRSLNAVSMVMSWRETRDRSPKHYVCMLWFIRRCRLQVKLSLEHLFHGSSLLAGPSSFLHVFLSNLATWFCRTGRSCIPGATMSWSGLA